MPTALSRVGLSLSGGGYRAAAFHLGVLAYLDHLELIGGLRALSTVSGGSFTGARYALSLVEERDFDDYFADYYRLLRDTHLVELGLKALVEDTPHVPSGRRDLSVAIGDVYSDVFFSKPDGEGYLMRALIDADISLERLIINTTEFRCGDLFRFARGAPSGSDALPIPAPDAGAVRVGDAVATSACFPGGFEPLAFPDDFHWPDDDIPAATRARFTEDGALRSVALMDGGIFDNQGVDSLLAADDMGDPLDLLVVSDVDREIEDLYPTPEAGDNGGMRLSNVALASTVLVVLATLTTAAILVELVQLLLKGGFDSVWQAIASLIPLVLCVTVLAALWWLRRQFFTIVLPSVPQLGRRSGLYLKRLRMRQVGEMLSLRLTSLLALTSDVYLRRIRTFGYQCVEDQPPYVERFVSVRIVRLKEGRDVPDIPGVDPPSPALRKVATEAARVPTLLWFDDDRQLPTLVAAGQATLCHALMHHLMRRFGDPDSLPPWAEALWSRMTDDWSRLNDDPFALVRERVSDLPASLTE